MMRSPACSRWRAAAMMRPSSDVVCSTGRSAISRGMAGSRGKGRSSGSFNVGDSAGPMKPPGVFRDDGIAQRVFGHGHCHAVGDSLAKGPASGDCTMAKIQLRDICEHLSAAAEVEGIVDALLAYLRAYQGDWHPTLALVDGQHDCVTRIFQRERGRLDHRDVVVPVDHLPARLVRKFFRPSAFFNAGERRSLLTKVFRVTPVYEPDRFEAPQIQPLVAPVPWHSCIVLPLADRDDLMALLLLVSPRKNAFPAAAVEEVLAMRTMAALALARRLQADGRLTPEVRIAEEQSRRSQGMFQERMRQLESESSALSQDNRLKAERLELVARELESTQLTAHRERMELDQLRQQVHSLEEQSSVAAQHLQDSYTQLAGAQHRLNEQNETMEFLREVFEASQEAYDESLMSRALVQQIGRAHV